MTWTAIIILLFVGLLLIALEIVVLPGAIAGIIGGAMLAIGVWQSYVTYGTVHIAIAILYAFKNVEIIWAQYRNRW